MVASEGRLSTRPSAPPSVCSTMSTTVRQTVGSSRVGPAMRSCPRNESMPRSEPERASEDLLHDLVRAATDRAEPSIAQRALEAGSGAETVVAVEVQAVVNDFEGGPLRGQLGHRHLARRVLAGQVATQRC